MDTFKYFLFFVSSFVCGPFLARAELPQIKIGATLATTGKAAFSGNATQQGLELAIEEANLEGGINGRKLQLIVEDNGGDPKSALTGVNKLLDLDKVDLMFSSFSHITQAIKDRVKRSGKVMFYAASLGSIAEESPLFFRDWGDATSEARSLAKAVSDRGFSNVAFFTETSEGCLEIERQFKLIAPQSNISIVTEESYSPGEGDLKPFLLRLSQKKPQAIVTCTLRDTVTLMPQMKNLGLIGIPTFQMFAPFLPVADTAEMRKLFEENKTVAIWLGFIEGSYSKEQKDFFERIKSKFNSTPRPETALAYDDIKVLVAALRICGADFTSECVSKELLKTDYHGVAGPLKFDDLGRSNRPDLFIKVKDGVWVDAS